MHAKTQMISEDTKRSDISPSQKDRRCLAHLKGETLLCRASQLQEMYGSEVCDAICALKYRKHCFNTQWFIFKKLSIQKNLKLS